MKLHEAVELLLKESQKSMSTKEIADQLNERKLYSKKDGSAITPFQIPGRTKNYPHIFMRQGSQVGLNVWHNEKEVTENNNDAKEKGKPIMNELLNEGDTTTIVSLEKNGFYQVGKLRSLLVSGLPNMVDLNSCGVYAIAISGSYTPEFIIQPEIDQKGNVINPWSLNKLEEKWVNGVEIIYYGLAGRDSFRTLKERINDLLDHGNGFVTDRGPHKGGEIMWQLRGYEDFNLWIRATGNPPNPRNLEEKLLMSFIKLKGKLPFANRQM